MIIDDSFIKSFENQLKVLTNLNNAVQSALSKATTQYNWVSAAENRGKDVKDIPDRGQQLSAAPGGGGKDHKGHR
jgi:hypothetical protein